MEAAVRALRIEALELIAGGRGIEEVARYVVERRNLLKVEFRRDLPVEIVTLIEERNRRRYGDAIGPKVAPQSDAGGIAA